MKKTTQQTINAIPIFLWFVIIPLIVKVKFFPNPLNDYPWYSAVESLADFFLYYKSLAVTIVGCLMLILLLWQIGSMKNRNTLFNKDSYIFIPIICFLFLAVASALFSEYKYFCGHGMPDQFETIWNMMAYVVALFFCYYFIRYQNCEKMIVSFIYIGASLVGLICVFQFLKLDIYRLIYAGEGYSFTFEEGTVYGPFYNINYVGYYVLLFFPLFFMGVLFFKGWKTKIISAVLSAFLIIALIGAKSVAAEIAIVAVAFIAIIFLLFKNVRQKKILWLPIITLLVLAIFAAVLCFPRVLNYIRACDTEKTDLENIYTTDECVEIDYKQQKLYIRILFEDALINFDVQDQDHQSLELAFAESEAGNYYYQILDDRFDGITVTPTIITEEPLRYGFCVTIDDRGWYFTNQMSEDGSYYYYSDQLKAVKLTEQTPSADFEPLKGVSSLASGRGYIWNKTIALLKNYLIFGSGADTFALVFPNGDFVDKYNNGYNNMIISKPHNLYLQIAVQNGVMALICFVVFYLWYFIDCIRIYYKKKMNHPLVAMGFAIMLGTAGYMISGLANDSTITIAPLYWGLLGAGIGINHKLKNEQ